MAGGPWRRGCAALRQRPPRAGGREAGERDQGIDASGAIALKGEQPAGAITIQAKNLDIAQTEKLALQNFGLGGRLNGTVKVEGSVDAPRVSGDATVTAGTFRTYKYDSLTAKVDFDGSISGSMRRSGSRPPSRSRRAGRCP